MRETTVKLNKVTYSYSRHDISKMLRDFESSKHCTNMDKESVAKVRKFFTDLKDFHSKMSGGFEETMEKKLRLLEELITGHPISAVRIHNDYYLMKISKYQKILLEDELYKEVEETLDKYHPKSPNFRCDELKISNYYLIELRNQSYEEQATKTKKNGATPQ